MSSFPGSPRLLKGGIALLDPDTGAVQQILPLQYNPDTLTRSFKIKGVGADSGDHIEALRLTGPPTETIKVEAEIDATDQLEVADTQAIQIGLHATLAALEMMVCPSSAHLSANNNAASAGTLEIVPAQTLLTVFIFGPRRIVPVRITEFSITEEAFDPALNPIRAKVSLGMTVLTVDDLGFEKKAAHCSWLTCRPRSNWLHKANRGLSEHLGLEAFDDRYESSITGSAPSRSREGYSVPAHQPYTALRQLQCKVQMVEP